MSIERLPHPLYASFWALRYVSMFGAIVFGHIVWLFVSVASFAPVEGLAIYQRTKFRDTLSEIWTWVLRKIGPEDTPLGWNLLAPIAAALEAMAVHVLLDAADLVPDLYIYLITIPLFALLWAHWWKPGGIGRWWPRT